MCGTKGQEQDGVQRDEKRRDKTRVGAHVTPNAISMLTAQRRSRVLSGIWRICVPESGFVSQKYKKKKKYIIFVISKRAEAGEI